MPPPSALLAPLARTLPVLAQRMGGVKRLGLVDDLASNLGRFAPEKFVHHCSLTLGSLVLPRKSRVRLSCPA